MDTLLHNVPTSPPPLPMRASPPSASPRAPGLGVAIGFIAMYFLLQIGLGLVAGLVVAVIVGVQAFLHGGWAALAGLEPRVQTTLEQPDIHAALIIAVLVGSALLTLWMAWKKWPRFWSMPDPPGFGFAMPNASAFFIVAIALGIAAPMLGGAVTHVLAGDHPVSQDIQQLGAQAQIGTRVVLALMVATLGPIVEELLFRGLLLSALMRRWQVGWAVAVTSLLFVLIHLPGLKLQWYALPDLFLLALALSWIRLKSGSIWPAVLTHATNNALAMLAWFLVIKPG
ncbi:type II CAAX endopeptidase family protein [Rhodanobacter sp. L36]|uniref:CPBP family intramembrane glutamic endopeptidase n=1 Tax=Rhodanobacter sp. L36 TaxID=1747221 RepID=UPI00131EC6F6|nr:type II CAAX endopeptidase family protein [Rhodanobacter sp. L36]